MSTQTNTAYDRAHDPQFNPAGASVGTPELPSGVISKKLKEGETEFKIKTSPIAFDSTTDAKLMTTLDVGTLINALFRKVFKDYEGCQIVLDPAQNRWKANLFFRKNANASTENAVENIIPLSSKAEAANGKPSIGRRIESISMLTSNISYKLTDATTDVLSMYYMPWEKNKKGEPNWKVLATEQQEPIAYGYNGSNIYVRIANLDVILLLKSIYGEKNELDHWVDYSITPIRPVTQFQSNTPNLLLSVQRVDCEVVKELYAKIAGAPVQGTLAIIR